jgi:hypothetical protein
MAHEGERRMRLAAVYSFNKGEEVVAKKYPELLVEVNDVIRSIGASQCKVEESKEKTMAGQMLYDPKAMNKCFKYEFSVKRKWRTVRVKCDYPTNYYQPDYKVRQSLRGAFREMDFVKEKLGIEVQFGKYSFMVYNVCAKMTIFKNLGHIDTGLEIAPVKTLALEMSSGVSYFEQFVWDIEQRGVADIDIPVLILGIDV